MAGRHQSEQVADNSPESLAEIVGIRTAHRLSFPRLGRQTLPSAAHQAMLG
jgi:hypothetical protein